MPSGFPYRYGLLAVTGVSRVDNLDLEVEAKEGAGLLPGVRVVPAEHLAIADMQVREFVWPYCTENGNQLKKRRKS